MYPYIQFIVYVHTIETYTITWGLSRLKSLCGSKAFEIAGIIQNRPDDQSGDIPLGHGQAYQGNEQGDRRVAFIVRLVADKKHQRQGLKKQHNTQDRSREKLDHLMERLAEHQADEDQDRSVNDDRPPGPSTQRVMAGEASTAVAHRNPFEKRHHQIHNGIRYPDLFDRYFPLREQIMNGFIGRDHGIRYRKRQLRQGQKKKSGENIAGVGK